MFILTMKTVEVNKVKRSQRLAEGTFEDMVNARQFYSERLVSKENGLIPLAKRVTRNMVKCLYNENTFYCFEVVEEAKTF